MRERILRKCPIWGRPSGVEKQSCGRDMKVYLDPFFNLSYKSKALVCERAKILSGKKTNHQFARDSLSVNSENPTAQETNVTLALGYFMKRGVQIISLIS